MKDEIKEIDNSDLMELLETTSKKDFYRLTLDHELVVRLYNWITNLQEEKEDYKSRCENAVEFTKKKESKKCYSNQITDDTQKVIGNFMWHTDKLLNILNGGDKE